MSATMYCQDCGKQLNRKAHTRGTTRCAPCANAERGRSYHAARIARIEDAEWLVSMGESWWHAAARVGTTIRGLEKAYRTEGMSAPGDLALLCYKHCDLGHCEACGVELSSKRYSMCKSCSHSLRNEMRLAA